MTKRTKNRTTGQSSRVTKKLQLIRMLSTKTGSDIAAISSKLEWQTHTTRAAITGLRKAGYGVESEKPNPGKPTRYRIVATPETGVTTATAPGANDAG